MSGHNKWSSIKHKKGALDKKKAKIFTKVIREIVASIKLGSANISTNPRLKQAIGLAKSVNIPLDTIQKTIKRANGNTDSENYETISYEGILPNNIAIIIECLSDNTNRTVANIRSIFNKKGGILGANNSVKYLFDQVGLIEIAKNKINEEILAEAVISAGGKDYKENEHNFAIYTAPKKLHQVILKLEPQFEIIQTKLCFLAKNSIVVDDLEVAEKIINFLDALEENDDVQKLYTNFCPSKKVLEEILQNDS